MGLTKRIFIDKDPAYEDVRRRAAREASDYCAQFTHRIATKRRNAIGDRPHWDPFWSNALQQAGKALAIETVNINGGMFFKTDADRVAVLALAETTWRDSIDRYTARISKR